MIRGAQSRNKSKRSDTYQKVLIPEGIEWKVSVSEGKVLDTKSVDTFSMSLGGSFYVYLMLPAYPLYWQPFMFYSII